MELIITGPPEEVEDLVAKIEKNLHCFLCPDCLVEIFSNEQYSGYCSRCGASLKKQPASA